jgi:hypothetical protein
MLIPASNALAARNAMQGQVIVQPSGYARFPGTCKRALGSTPPYLPCTTPGWVGAANALTNQWDAPPAAGTPTLLIEPTLDQCTFEWQTFAITPDASTLLDFAWSSSNGNDYFETLQFNAPTTGGFVEFSDATHDDYSPGDGGSLAGRIRWAAQRSAAYVTLFRNGTIVTQIPRTTLPLYFDTAPGCYFYFFCTAPGAGKLQWSRFAISNIARYPDTGYDPATPLANDANTLLTWLFTEASGTTATDTQSASILTFDSPPNAPAWYTTPDVDAYP